MLKAFGTVLCLLTLVVLLVGHTGAVSLCLCHNDLCLAGSSDCACHSAHADIGIKAICEGMPDSDSELCSCEHGQRGPIQMSLDAKHHCHHLELAVSTDLLGFMALTGLPAPVLECLGAILLPPVPQESAGMFASVPWHETGGGGSPGYLRPVRC